MARFRPQSLLKNKMPEPNNMAIICSLIKAISLRDYNWHNIHSEHASSGVEMRIVIHV